MKHVTKYFLEYHERTLPTERSELIRSHLEHCSACRDYFHDMRDFMEILGTPDTVSLSPDPFLPTRARAFAAENGARPRSLFSGAAQWSMAGVLSLVAVAIGISIGTKLSDAARPVEKVQQVSDKEILSEY